MWQWLGKLVGFGRAGVSPVTSIANATTNVAEVFVENKTRKMELQASARQAALAQFAAEFSHQRTGLFDRFVDALNRLPRPVLALGTLYLFFQAWHDRATFVDVMEALAVVPEPLWILLGAIVTFYFGARETHHWRRRADRSQALNVAKEVVVPDLPSPPPDPPEADPDFEPTEPNAALDAWRAERAQESGT